MNFPPSNRIISHHETSGSGFFGFTGSTRPNNGSSDNGIASILFSLRFLLFSVTVQPLCCEFRIFFSIPDSCNLSNNFCPSYPCFPFFVLDTIDRKCMSVRKTNASRRNTEGTTTIQFKYTNKTGSLPLSFPCLPLPFCPLTDHNCARFLGHLVDNNNV